MVNNTLGEDRRELFLLLMYFWIWLLYKDCLCSVCTTSWQKQTPNVFPMRFFSPISISGRKADRRKKPLPVMVFIFASQTDFLFVNFLIMEFRVN